MWTRQQYVSVTVTPLGKQCVFESSEESDNVRDAPSDPTTPDEIAGFWGNSECKTSGERSLEYYKHLHMHRITLINTLISANALHFPIFCHMEILPVHDKMFYNVNCDFLMPGTTVNGYE